MSAIFGVYRRDGRPVDLAEIATVGDSLKHRGERVPQIWARHSVAVGHCMLMTTPESVGEQQPYYSDVRGYAITADARIDNREELIRLLGIVGELTEIPDSTVILAAYERWGELCPEHLLGDFAFAIWDEKQQQLFCARDQFGVKPFYYAFDVDRLVFASEIGALFHCPSVVKEANPAMVASFLAGLLDEEEETLYVGIKRLCRGHSLTCKRGSVTKRRYYELNPKFTTCLRDDREYAEAFREIFTRALERRLRAKSSPACTLSGGLDSSAVASVAQGLLQTDGRTLTTMSAVFPGEDYDESPYINAVLQTGRFEGRTFPACNRRSLEELLGFFEGDREPSWGLGLFTMGAFYGPARELGHNVLLSGHGGDEVVSLGYAWLRELAVHGQWFTLAREWIALREVNGGLRLRALANAFVTFGTLGKIGRRFARRQPLEKSPAASRPWALNINPELLDRTDMVNRYGRMQALQFNASCERESHFKVLNYSGQSRFFEDLDRTAGASAVEPRYPFWDREMVEFCLSLPSRQKLSRGRTRAVMRRALSGVLTNKVRNRLGKTDFTSHALTCLRSIGEENIRGLIDGGESGKAMVCADWYSQAVSKLFGGDSEARTYLHPLWRSISVLIWLQRLDRNPRMRPCQEPEYVISSQSE